MTFFPPEYKAYVLEDIQNNKDIRKIVKANFIERLFTKKMSPFKMHANPDDEFSMEHIGPNFEIVNRYMKDIQELHALNLQVFEEPVIVEKLSPEGFMLVNGHHRWLAALRMREYGLHVQIVNLVHEEDISQMLEKSVRNMRVSFDLDEVLFAASDCELTEKPVTGDIEKIFSKRLKKGIPDMFRKLQGMGYDIWVYTSGYYSSDDIQELFKQYNVELDGIVNAMRRNRTEEGNAVKSAIKRKYKVNAHADNGHVLYVNSENHNYEYVTLNTESTTWCDDVVKCIGELNG